MREWRSWDWCAYAALLVAAVITAADAALHVAPNLMEVLPHIFSREFWAFSPLVLIVVATVILLMRHMGWVGPRVAPRVSGPNAAWSDALETIHRRTYTNEHVVLDGKRFNECEFVNVSFVYHGTGPFRFDASKTAGAIELITDVKAINAYHALLHDMNVSPGTKTIEYGVRIPETGGTHIARALTKVQPAKDEPPNKPE